MSTVQEIEAVIPRLSRAEMERIRDVIDEILEDQVELTDEVVAKIEQSKKEIAEGKFAARTCSRQREFVSCSHETGRD